MEEICSADAFAADLCGVHDFHDARRAGIERAAPSAAHRALALLEEHWAREGRGEFTLITQNVDNLHERGCRAVSRNALSQAPRRGGLRTRQHLHRDRHLGPGPSRCRPRQVCPREPGDHDRGQPATFGQPGFPEILRRPRNDRGSGNGRSAHQPDRDRPLRTVPGCRNGARKSRPRPFSLRSPCRSGMAETSGPSSREALDSDSTNSRNFH